ncbi:hypothetical protein DPMN_028338 [Dreissena polymorpha]|uniref:Uncharacterized protein n=1 Tax=Dreissena polymorpha TaxID=45954 RepID=A0A9D4LWZ9_DREPO|nr:hypothetical protein DPMN_028338 [Dreissena polymorpha]
MVVAVAVTAAVAVEVDDCIPAEIVSEAHVCFVSVMGNSAADTVAAAVAVVFSA